VFTARYALSPYIKQIRFVFKGLNFFTQEALVIECVNMPLEVKRLLVFVLVGRNAV
jgi:hypothetical protein